MLRQDGQRVSNARKISPWWALVRMSNLRICTGSRPYNLVHEKREFLLGPPPRSGSVLVAYQHATILLANDPRATLRLYDLRNRCRTLGDV
jgi:hypothetical protein